LVSLDKKFKTVYGTGIYAIAVAAALACNLISSVVLSLVLSGEGREVVQTALGLIFQAANLAVFLAFILIKRTKPDILWRMGVKFAENTYSRTKSAAFATIFCAAGVIFGLVCLFFFASLATAGQYVLSGLGYKLAPQYSGAPLQNVFLLIITVAAAPVCEELIYRSALAGGLKKRFNDFAVAALAGVAFALMHMNPEQTIYQFFLGFGATLLTLTSGSVIPAIIMHAVSNLAVALNMVGAAGFTHYFDWYMAVFTSDGWRLGLSAPFLAAVGLAIFVFGAKLLKKYANRYSSSGEEKAVEEKQKLKRGIEEEKVGFLASNAAMLLYTLGLAVSLFMWISIFVSRLNMA